MSTCVAVIADARYQKYLPMFVYFCLKSYGNVGVGVKLFLFEALKPKYRQIMEELKSLGRLEIEEHAFRGYPIVDQELKTARWLLKSDRFSGYRNVYIGDADLMICKERVPFYEQHLNHCSLEGKPYSNMLRPNSDRRMTGLHFFMKDPYYKVMNTVIDDYEELLLTGKLIETKNETVLYNMMEKSFGLPEHVYWAHHGIHLGYWRRGRRQRRISKLVWDIVGKDSYNEYYKFFVSVKEDPLYKKVYDVYPLKEIIHMDTYFKEEFDL